MTGVLQWSVQAHEKRQAGKKQRGDALSAKEQLECMELSCGTDKGLVRAHGSEPREGQGGRQHGGSMLPTMGSGGG